MWFCIKMDIQCLVGTDNLKNVYLSSWSANRKISHFNRHYRAHFSLVHCSFFEICQKQTEWCLQSRIALELLES